MMEINDYWYSMCREIRLFIGWILGQNYLLYFLVCLIVFLANNRITMLFLVFLRFLIVALIKVPVSFIYKRFKTRLWLLLFTFLLHIFLTKEGPSYF